MEMIFHSKSMSINLQIGSTETMLYLVDVEEIHMRLHGDSYSIATDRRGNKNIESKAVDFLGFVDSGKMTLWKYASFNFKLRMRIR